MVLHQAELRSPMASGILLRGIRSTSLLLQKILLRGIGNTLKNILCRCRLSRMTRMPKKTRGEIGVGMKKREKYDWIDPAGDRRKGNEMADGARMPRTGVLRQ